MSLSKRFDDAVAAGDESAIETLEGALRVLGGPGSGWSAEAGHVPGSQGGLKNIAKAHGRTLSRQEHTQFKKTLTEHGFQRASGGHDFANYDHPNGTRVSTFTKVGWTKGMQDPSKNTYGVLVHREHLR